MQLKVDGNDIAYADWRVPISHIGVIGEFLSQGGRGRSEHFIVFMTREEWFKAPYQAEGRDTVLAELGLRLNHTLRCELFNATNFSSRVLWPAQLEGRPLFDLNPEQRSENMITRARQLLLQKVDMRFTDEVQRELGRA